MTRSRVCRALAVVTLVAVRVACAQHGDSTFTLAVQAYDNLDFRLASALFRRVVAGAPRARGSTELEPALSYLGASEWFVGRRDSAMSVFRTLVILDPRFRPNDLVFPPEVTGAFAEVRRTTKVLDVSTSADTTVQAREGRFVAWLVASSPHSVSIVLLREDGTAVRTLYSGPIGDSLEVRWDGLDSAGEPVGPGTLLLSATSRAPDGHAIRTVRVPLDITVAAPPMVAAPAQLPDSVFLPEHEARHGSVTSLAAGVIDGLFVAVLPSIVAADGQASAARFVIAGGLGIAGLVGFVTHRGTRPLPENAAANERLRQAWQHRADTMAQENAERRREPELTIHVGPRVVLEQEAF